MPVIDFHTHAFPEALAARAVPMLEDAADVKAKLDGRISSLLKSMDDAGIERSVICSIATKPEHFGPILKWSQEIASERIVPLASVHPADPLAAQRVRAAARAGLRGIKLHPYYQSFDLDEVRVAADLRGGAGVRADRALPYRVRHRVSAGPEMRPGADRARDRAVPEAGAGDEPPRRVGGLGFLAVPEWRIPLQFRISG